MIMKILWLTWKDMQHPLAGGAEVVTSEITKKLAEAGHEVHIVSGGFKGGARHTEQNGCKVTRVGGKFTVYWYAYKLYKNKLAKENWDVVIEEINTIPFMSKWYVKNTNHHLFFHQLAREIWFYQMPQPISLVGYFLEPMYLWMLRKSKVITISNSTKQDLMKYGFKGDNISIISEGITLRPLATLAATTKYTAPTILSLGAIRPMKRTLDVVKGFEILKETQQDAQLIIAGDSQGKYADKVLEHIKASKHKSSIQTLGRVDLKQKAEIMQKSHLIAVTSIKEGWGLIVTEANSQGTPAVVYNVDGLRDSVQNFETGLIAEHNTPKSLAKAMQKALTNTDLYDTLRENAWQWSKSITFEQAYKDFCKVVGVK
jgi:glycosyltransferase involved in cell wall biosynthesis